jgi:cell division protease FtsH
MGWMLIGALVFLLLSFMQQGFEQRRTITADEFWTHVHNGHVTGELVITSREIHGENPEGTPNIKSDQPTKFRVSFPREERGEDFEVRLRTALAENDNPATYRYERESWWQELMPHLLLTVLLFGALWFFLFRRMGQAGGAGFLGNFGRSRHRVASKEQSKVTFKDVAGIDEAKDEVREIVEFLRSPRKFQRLGGRIPRGVLLMGEPGCGKTLLAKAIAGEADVPVFAISGSDFVEMFVGVGASRVRDLFKQARDAAPCIIFLDEVDAIGRRRSGGMPSGGGDEREQTLNAILVEMDGLGTSDQVIVIAATNRTDVLDPALTRPGRFDRTIQVPLPDLKGRYEILKIYAHRVECSAEVDLQRLARGTPMFSGADLEALVNEAAIAATLADKQSVEQADLEEARDRVRWGRARKSRVIDEQEKNITAYHEAGHALVQVLVPEADPLHKVSIIPRGSMGGATFVLPEKDRYLYTRTYCRAQMSVLFGGRVAEELVFDDVSSGAASDIAHATSLARTMVVDWGMSDELGLISFNEHTRRPEIVDLGMKEYSDRTAEIIDSEIKAIVDKGHENAQSILQSHRAELERVAEALLKHETLEADEVKTIMEGGSLAKTTVNDLIEAEHAKGASEASSSAEAPTEMPIDSDPNALAD